MHTLMGIHGSRKPHHPGGNNGDGVMAAAHVCHRCGWAFPNPHPSAKLRRAHKKLCGRVPGFEVGEKKVSEEEGEEEHSDEDGHNCKNDSQKELLVCKEVEEEERGGAEKHEKRGGVELVEKSAGLEDNVVDLGNDTVEPHDLAGGKHLRVPKMETVADESENDRRQLEEKALCSCSVIGISTDRRESSSLLTETSISDGLEERPDQSQAQNVDSSLIVNDKDVGACVRNDIENNVTLVPFLPAYPAADAELQRLDKYAETDARTDFNDGNGTVTKDFPERLCASICEVDPKASNPKNDLNEAGKLYGNGFHSSGESCLVECTGNLEAAADFCQSDFVSEMTHNCRVQEEQNVSATPRLVITPSAEISADFPQSKSLSETFANTEVALSPAIMPLSAISSRKLEICDDHESMQHESSFLSAVMDAAKDPDCELEDKDPKFVQPEVIAAELQQNEDSVLPNMQLQRESSFIEFEVSRTATNESNEYEIAKDRHDNGEAYMVKDCQAVVNVALPDSQDAIVLETEKLDANSYAISERLPAAAVVAFDAPVRGLCKLEMLPTQVQEMKNEFTSERLEISHSLSNEVMTGKKKICIGDHAVPVVNERSEGLKDTDGNQVVDDEITLVDTDDFVNEYKQVTVEDPSWSEAEVNIESASNIAETTLPSDGYIRPIELERSQYIGPSLLGCASDSKTVDSNSQNLLNTSRANSHEVDSEKTLQERSTGLCVDNSTNNAVTVVEAQSLDIEIDSNRAKESCNELDFHKVQMEHLGSLSRTLSDQLGSQENTRNMMVEPAVSIDVDHPTEKTDLQTEDMETESALCGSALCVATIANISVQSEDILEPYCDQHFYEEAVQEKITGHVVDSDTDHSMIKVARIEFVENQSRASNHCELEFENTEDLSTHISYELDHQRDDQKSSTDLAVGSKDHSMTGTDAERQMTGTQLPDHIEDTNIGLTSEVAIFGMPDQLPRENGKHIVYDQPTAAGLVAKRTSLDPNSQADSVKMQGGSISEAKIPLTRHVYNEVQILDSEAIPAAHSHSLKELCASNSEKEAVVEHNSVESMDIFEKPSFVSLVEDGDHPVSSEILEARPQHSKSSPQADQLPSVLNGGHESPGRKNNEEITLKLERRNPSKPHVPLKILLVEANLESKQKAANARDHNDSQVNRKGQVLEDATKPTSKLVSEKYTGSFNKADQKEWNSPAKLPTRKNEKGRSKGRPLWVPFICCPSMN